MRGEEDLLEHGRFSMRMATGRTIILSFLIGTSVHSLASGLPRSRIVIHFVDDEGHPLAGVHVVTDHYDPPTSWEGLTDSNGVFKLIDRIAGPLSCQAKKTGYYDTEGELWGPREGELVPPTNQYTVLLKRIVNPVPMISKKADILLPKVQGPFAFDFEIGELVRPFGKGVCPDVWLRAEKRFVAWGDQDLRLTLSFSNNLDGIRDFIQHRISMIHAPASALTPPQTAPTSGYSNMVTATVSRHPKQSLVWSYCENRNYLFRIRAETNATGEVTQSLHGWIESDFHLGPSAHAETFQVNFTYQLNPNPRSRSLEAERPKK